MEIERFEEIMDSDVGNVPCEGCRIFEGLKLIAKYLPKSGIGCAEHDQIWACQAQDLIDAGLTEEDAKTLRGMNWFLDCDALSHFA